MPTFSLLRKFRLVLGLFLAASGCTGLPGSGCAEVEPMDPDDCVLDDSCASPEPCPDAGCVERLRCDDALCAPFQLCEEPAEGDATCLSACADGYTWNAETSSCEQPQCETLACSAQGRECETSATPPSCGGCLSGLLEDDDVCRAPLACADMPCPPDELCIDAGALVDAECVVGECPPNSILDGATCEVCPACDAVERGEDGAFLDDLTLENKCICRTLPGYFWRESGFPGVFACDADGDGWVKESAKGALEAPSGSAVKVNARCTLRQIDTIVLRNEVGQERAVSLGETIALYETDRNDEQGLIDLAQTAGDLSPFDAGGRPLQAAELNSLTKACINSQADHNENSLADVTEWHGNGATDTVQATFLPFIDWAYFVELYQGWWVADDAGGPGRYVIAERTREATVGSVAVVPADGASDYWRQCDRQVDRDFAERIDSGAPLTGLDFSAITPDENWVGMLHHSSFKCVQVVDQEDAEPMHLTISEIEGARYQLNNCSIQGATAPPTAEADSKNPSSPAIDCVAAEHAAAANGDVRWAAVGYRDYTDPAGYRNGCINECIEAPGLCPGWNPDPVLNTSMCLGAPDNFGEIFCGCHQRYAGPNCEVACPGMADGQVSTRLHLDPAFGLAPRRGYWLCAKPTTTVGISALIGTAVDYRISGGIAADPRVGAACQNPADCQVGYAVR